MALLAPLSTIFGPYMYIRRTLQWRVPIRQYLKFIKVGIVAFLRPAVLPEHTALKYVVLAGYIGLLIYGILQAFDLAATLSRVRKQLAEKADSVRAIFGCAAGADLLPSGLAGAYALATDPHIRALVADRLRELYAQDVAVLTGDLARQPRWCIPDYRTGGQIWDLRHPVLASDDADTKSTAAPVVGNPADLSRSLIVTGPNAAGKTTYTKALAANLLLAQTLGVVCARRADLAPVDAFGAFVRVSDTIGEASLYQAEVQRCADLCTQATALSAAGRRAVYILDEPMRSTPPTEGAATAAAVVGYLTRLPGIRVIMTSHFAVLTELATAMPDRVHNIHMAAEPAAKGGFTFSYRLRRGPSFQCIALELLAAGGSTAATLPKEVIQSAIEIKNKICRGIVSNGDQPIANGTSA
jgi:DNA mismatch repair ATPase MutS